VGAPLVAHDLTTVRAGRMLTRALNIELRPGELWGVLGPNGCGKSTLLLTLAGLLAPGAGQASLGGRAAPAWPARERARRIGLLPQEGGEGFHGTVNDFVALGRLPHGDRAAQLVAHAIAAMDLAALAARACERLSGGERQRARIAQLLAQEAAVMLLDEPFVHLDLAHQARAMDRLEQRARAGAAIMLTLHDQFWAARRATHLLLLDAHGGWQAGRPEELLTPERLARLYGCELDAGLAPAPTRRYAPTSPASGGGSVTAPSPACGGGPGGGRPQV
jgi:iron complex transport system ATP-binding protein